MTVDPVSIKQSLRFIAGELGFDFMGVARAGRAPHADFFLEWLERGCSGTMEWMGRQPERRADPRNLLPDCRSVIVLGMNYYPGEESLPEGGGRFARYAWGEDYHEMLESRLADLTDYLTLCGGEQKFYVDAGPVLERDWAVAAGAGWCGRSSLLIRPGLGSWTFLAAVLTTLELPADEPVKSRCGFCRRCVESCPAGAIDAENGVDARKCVSYLTIENRGEIPVESRRMIGGRVYGCDTCLEACPWNKKAERTSEPAFLSNRKWLRLPLREYLTWTEEEFALRFRRSPIRRIKWRGFMRNVCVAVGNTGGREDLPALDALCACADELVAEHARWAAAEIRRRLYMA